jgi:hypothetical protein
MELIVIKYPLSSAKISVDVMPFGFWFVPQFRHRRTLTEEARQQGERIWWLRWAWFQVSYSRWV